MYIDTYNTNNEDERFKKYVEILKSHDQLKKSLWNKINTPEVLRLKEESDKYFDKYYKANCQVQSELISYSRKNNLRYIPYISEIKRNPNIPDELKELIKISEQKWDEYKKIKNQYKTLLFQNSTQLVYNITSENSVTFLQHDGTKEVFTEFRKSFKPFLIIITAMGTMIVLNHNKLCKCDQHFLDSVTMYKLNDHKHYYDTNKHFFDDVSSQMKEYKDFLLPDEYSYPPMTCPVPVPLKMPYILKAQSFWENYGRTDDYLLIGFMIYRPDKN